MCAECESVSHVLWDCPAYASIRSALMFGVRLSLDSFAKSSFILGSGKNILVGCWG